MRPRVQRVEVCACAPQTIPCKWVISGVFVGIGICASNCRVHTCCCVVMSMCLPLQTMEVMPVVWRSLAPNVRRGRRWGGSLHWSSSRKPRWGRRLNMRWQTGVHIYVQSVCSRLCLSKLWDSLIFPYPMIQYIHHLDCWDPSKFVLTWSLDQTPWDIVKAIFTIFWYVL